MSTLDNSNRIGHFVNSFEDKNVKCYIPKKLPPVPRIQIEKLFDQLEQANIGLGRLDEVSSIIPDETFYISIYTKKEALLSSQIEGTQSTLTDVLLYEEEGIGKKINYDAQEVSNYSTAMSAGLDELNNIPISNRLIRLVHRNLMQGVRGGEKSPGEFRISQNWIGGSRPDKARFVPPPPTEVQNLMSDLGKYIHSDSKDLPFLIKLGLIHVQFETIHPFLDGNGRIGRLLIILLLCEKKFSSNPFCTSVYI